MTVVPEEIPRDPRANRRWFLVMLANRELTEREYDPRYVELSHFVSKAFLHLPHEHAVTSWLVVRVALVGIDDRDGVFFVGPKNRSATAF